MKKFPLKNDPEFAQENRKYKHAVASRQYILSVLESLGKPASFDELCQCFDLKDETLCQNLRFRLKAMVRDGQIIQDRQHNFGLISHMNLKKGRVIAHVDGFGFVKMDEGGEDWFLTPKEMSRLMPNDRVLVRIKGINQRGRIEAGVVRVLEEGNKQLVGEYLRDSGLAYVVPEDKKIPFDVYINEEEGVKAKPGELVLVEITQRPGNKHPARGIIKEVIGKRMAPGMEIEVALRSFDLPFLWPEDVKKQVAALKTKVQKADYQGREDLLHLPFVTIDGADARDFDDAVYCEKAADSGWTLWVAIADVSHYVHHNSALDSEGLSRGNSVYFPGEVIPMLPEVLSNGLCSLNPDVIRLVMVAEMQVSSSGQLTSSKFYPAMIQSQARLTYSQVWDYLNKTTPELAHVGQNNQITASVDRLYQLFHSLFKARKERGGIDFDTTETRFIFNANRKIENIVPVFRNDAHRLIEECMILANVAAAHFLLKTDPVGIYRNHTGPTEERLAKLRDYLGQLGLSLSGGSEPSPKDYAALLEKISDRDDKENIHLMLLRSLSQADYEVENKGHFGLALDAYSHFTSPIRRYPDLILHRLIKDRLKLAGKSYKGLDSGFHYEKEELLQLTEHCSMTERRADDATRDVNDWLRSEFMQDKIGLEYAGKIVSVTSFGLFVRLDDIYVEGLIHVSALKRDYYHFDPVANVLAGERSGKRYGIGDELKIRVIRVNLEERKIDFELIEDLHVGHHPGNTKKTKSKHGKHQRREANATKNKKPLNKNASSKVISRKKKKKTAPKKQRKAKARKNS